MLRWPSAAPALHLTFLQQRFDASFEAYVLEHHSIFLLSPGLLNTFPGSLPYSWAQEAFFLCQPLPIILLACRGQQL